MFETLTWKVTGDWEDRKSGYYPFRDTGDDRVPEDPEGGERRGVLKNPFWDKKKNKDPTGVIVTSHTSHRAKTVMKNLQYQKIYLTPTKQKCLENFWNRSIHPVKYA